MFRIVLRLTPIFSVLFLAMAGCEKPAATPGKQDGHPSEVGEGNLVLLLPEYKEFPTYDRMFKLTIDDKDYTEPKATKQKKVTVKPAEGKDTVHLVLSFWPVQWSNTVRTRTVKINPTGETVVDLTQEDPAFPDHYQPIYFQTPQTLLDEMMKLGKVGPNDVAMDIGCGDGRLVITAVKQFGAKKGIGLDIRDELVELCKNNAKEAGVEAKTEFLVQDALKLTDISHVSVVFLYLGEDLCRKLQPLLQKTLKPGSRIISLDFPIGDWKPDEVKTITTTNNYGKPQQFKLSLWTVK